MNNIIFIITLITVIYIGSYFYRTLVKYLNYKKRQSYVEKHILYATVLDFYMEKAFDIIYKDRVLIYSIEGTKPSDEDIKKNSVDFSKLTLQLLGPMLVEEYIFMYGNEETLFFNIAEFFNTKSEGDEIKQESINSMINGNENENV